MNNINVCVVQMKVVNDKNKNLDKAIKYIKEASSKNCDMIILPEMFICPYENNKFREYSEPQGGSSFTTLSKVAKENDVYLVCGSMPEIDSDDNLYNTSYVFDRNGDLIAKHQKMHLFDIDLPNGKSVYESDVLTAGDNVCVFDSEFGKIGLCICYDLRFVELSRAMINKGAKAIIVPGAFNMTTGPAHWELLFKSRAVDNQVYTIGCAPSRDSECSYVSYGNSIIVSPWGEIVSRLDENEGCLYSQIDFDYVDKIRNKLPLLKHRRLELY